MVNAQRCPSCLNQFVQPFVCTTCGAEKLYDETVRSQAAEINHLRAERDELRGLVAEFVESCDGMDDDPIDGEPLMVRARRALARIDAALAEGAEKRLPLSVCASCGHTWTEDTVWCARCAERI